MEKKRHEEPFEELPVEQNLPPPSALRRLGKVAEQMTLYSEEKLTPLEVVTSMLIDAPNGEVGLSRYKQAMRESGYTGEEAVLELDTLIQRGEVILSNRYRVSIPADSNG